MKMSDQIRIMAPRESVYAALNDVNVLKSAIPGCEEIEKISDTEMTAIVVTKVGPVKAKFKGKVTLSDLNPPTGYTISGEGAGGAAGFAKGSATISLEEDGTATILKYNVNADVGGKLAQIGSRLIDSSSRKLAAEFFAAFEGEVSTDPQTQTADKTEPDIPAIPSSGDKAFVRARAWGIIIAAGIATTLIFISQYMYNRGLHIMVLD